MGDVSREYYRSKQEEQGWKGERDPLKVMSGWLAEQGIQPASLDATHAEVKAEVDKAVQFAIAAPYPAVDKVDQDVYA